MILKLRELVYSGDASLLSTRNRQRVARMKRKERQLTPFEPAFSFAEMEALRSIWAYMTPATSITIWALYTC